MSSSSLSQRSRRFQFRRQPVVVDIGCSCRKPKLFSLLNLSRYNYHPSSSSKSKSKSKSSSESSTCSLTTTITNSTFSPCNDTTSSTSSSYSPKKKKKQQQQQQQQKKKGTPPPPPLLMMAEESVAVEKVSSDPYMDFKESMLQMIVEKEIYQWEDLRELLNLFLSLNSPYHHHLILRAFAEIWEGVFSPAPR